MTKLVYIGGYGHSGSTLLEYLLTGCAELVACGEVASVIRDRLKKQQCTCGRRSEACPIWSQVLSSDAPLAEKTHEALTLALLARAGKRYDLMVDSTKTPWPVCSRSQSATISAVAPCNPAIGSHGPRMMRG